MAWRIQPLRAEAFVRNPLSSVVAELRFQPVLSIDQNDERIAEFQDKIRAIFPTYSENQVQEITIPAPNTFSANSKRVFEFGNLSGTSQLRLTSGNLALVRTNHADRQGLVEEFQAAVKALYEVYETIAPARLGVLYTNVIDKGKIAENLGETLEWQDLIKSDYFPLRVSNALNESFQFSTQITDSIPNGVGELSVRYALMREQNKGSGSGDGTVFRLDIDRSELNPVIDEQNISTFIESYANDIYMLFMDIAENKLLDWMRQEES